MNSFVRVVQGFRRQPGSRAPVGPTALVLLVLAGTAFAQPAPQAPAAPASGWRDGFILQDESGDFRLQGGLLAHADGRFALADSGDVITDTFLLRRLRPNVRVRLAGRFDIYFNPEVSGGAIVIQDTFVDTRFATALRLRLGKAKTPFGLEVLHSASGLLFLERALPSVLAPNRDIGIQVLGDLAGGAVSYSAALLNGTADGGSVDTDINDGKDVAGRLLVKPFAGLAGSPLTGLSLAVAGTTGRQAGSGALSSLRTPTGRQVFFTYSGASADGIRTRYSPQVSYYHGPFGGFAEYVHTTLPVAKGGVRQNIESDAWQAAVAWVLTGEDATDRGVQPRADFDFGGGHLGAWQVAARYHALAIDETAVTLGLAGSGASRKAEAWTVGLNWYLAPYLKYVVNFERTIFDGDPNGSRKAENVLVFRSQLNF